jgi:RNA polymerase sigma factor
LKLVFTNVNIIINRRRGKKLRELDYKVVDAKENLSILTQLIEQNEAFIIKAAVKVAHCYISKSDDEYSIALLAFNEAVKSYNLEKGSFLSFAELVIHRRVIDYYRKQEKHSCEISVNPVLLDNDVHLENEDVSLSLAISEKIANTDNGSLTLEINTANEVFLQFGFTFFDLTSCSPKSKKTKVSCGKAISYILSNSFLILQIHSSKQLPLKIIEKSISLPRKTLERHRKYIIAAVVILSGEYPNLAEYLQFIKEEMDK